MVKIAVLASFNMDLVMRTERRPAAGETLQGEFAMFLGGKGFNQAIAARRLGAEVVVAGRVGDDEFGRLFLDALDREGIDRRAVVVDATAGTGVASIIVEPDGTNTIVQAPRANRNVVCGDWQHSHGDPLLYDDLEVSAILDDVDLTLVNLETNVGAALAFQREMWAFGRNWQTMLNAAPASVDPRDLLRYSRIVVANEIEAEALTGTRCDTVEGASKAAHTLRDRGGLAVITLGRLGAVAEAEGTHVGLPAFDVEVVDTVGAGDAFCAALAVRLAEHAHLVDAVRFANAAGALACTKHGAEPSMPTRDEVEALLAKGVTA
jgi:ribokinase